MLIKRPVAFAASAVLSVATLVACQHGGGSMVPTPTTPAASQAPGAGPQVRRVAISRDSLAKLRELYVAQVMNSIAGRENEPADQVFKNVQVLKGITAAQLVDVMDKQYSAALSFNCTSCHRFAAQGDFASDTTNNKKRARFMQQMVNDINTSELPKLYPRNTPKVSCATCHRGYNEPPPPQYLLPERGQPGGVPFPPPRRPGHDAH